MLPNKKNTGFTDMHIYNLKMKFYRTPRIRYGACDADARALASLANGTSRTRAKNGRSYWYLFIKDVQNRDLVRFLLRRNGVIPEYHISSYYGMPQPAFRVRVADLGKHSNLDEFTRSIDRSHQEDDKTAPDTLRYIDEIKTRLAASKQK